jgi:plastocyanin
MIEELWSGLIAFSTQFVVPDWGALVALIPLGLAAIVCLSMTWTVYRFATAGPTRRGMRRRPPVTPSGIHMPGPSFAPLLAAVGLFFTVFGMVAGGIWLWVGLAVLVITLLYWGREEMRGYDRLPATAGGGHAVAGGYAAVGALPGPAGTAPEGVHLPPPSFRPLLVAIGFTALVGGMVVGGWALFLGFIAIVLTLLGWLWDARKEYTAVEDADRTGHLDAGGAPAWPKATFAALGIIVILALLLTSKIVPDTGSSGAPGASGAPIASSAPGGGGSPASAAPSVAPAADVVVVAEGIKWTETAITVPAGKPFTLALTNRDAATPHDVVIKDARGANIFKGALVTGPAVVVYDVPAIPAGQYTFVCTVHPNMTGTVTAQ